MNNYKRVGVVRNVEGSVISPQGGGLKFVLNTISTNGSLNCPTYPILHKKWAKVRESLFQINSYRTAEYGMGYVKDLSVQSDVWIMHMMCRDDKDVMIPDGLKKCVANVGKSALYEKATVHIASELVDSFPVLSNLIKTELLEKGVDVYIYTAKKFVSN